jgi:disulfide bond formation protein DsbB
MFVTSVNLFWAVMTVVANLLSIAIVALLVSPKLRQTKFAAFFRDRAVLVAFLSALLATIGSLIYSDVIGYEPCKLCWFQRIAMYPQALVLGMALFRKDMSVRIYALVLSIIGAAIALYHYVGQLGFNPFGLECLAIGYSSSCSKNFVLQLGYITIPMMAFSAFLFMSLILWYSMRKDN